MFKLTTFAFFVFAFASAAQASSIQVPYAIKCQQMDSPQTLNVPISGVIYTHLENKINVINDRFALVWSGGFYGSPRKPLEHPIGGPLRKSPEQELPSVFHAFTWDALTSQIGGTPHYRYEFSTGDEDHEWKEQIEFNLNDLVIAAHSLTRKTVIAEIQIFGPDDNRRNSSATCTAYY
jgi:hypothetical protein